MSTWRRPTVAEAAVLRQDGPHVLLEPRFLGEELAAAAAGALDDAARLGELEARALDALRPDFAQLRHAPLDPGVEVAEVPASRGGVLLG